MMILKADLQIYLEWFQFSQNSVINFLKVCQVRHEEAQIFLPRKSPGVNDRQSCKRVRVCACWG